VIAKVDLEPRLLIPALLPMVALAGYGVMRLTNWLPSLSLPQPLRTGTLCGLFALVYIFVCHVPDDVTVSAHDGLAELVSRMRQESRGPSSVILVAGSCGASDGRIIAGLAEKLKDRSQTTILRAEKLLAESDWGGDHYSARFTQPDQVIKELDADGVSLVAIDTSNRWNVQWPHEALLVAAADEHPERMQLLYASNPPIYRLYRFRSEHPAQLPDRVLKNLQDKMQHMRLPN
jgi:hypothetical protein